MRTYRRRSPMPVSAEELFRWHERPGALDRLLPPWERTEILERPDSLRDGSRAVLGVPLGPWRVRWVAEHRGYRPGVGFEDVQQSGPFAHWHHRHRMHPRPDGTSELEDHVEYAPPGGALGGLLLGRRVHRTLDRMFAWRHARTARDLARHGETPHPLRIAITGSGGFVGSALAAFLTTGGHEVLRVQRRGARRTDADAVWDPASGGVTRGALEDLDAVVHLAGEGIADGRWTDAKKHRIRASRVGPTRLLASTLAGLRRPPKAFLCASAIGWYGARADEVLTEDAAAGTGFLADVCRDWEAATAPAREAGIRTVNLRFGIILDPRGGALARLLPIFRAGLGGRVGHGRQWMSWVSLDDVLGTILRAAHDDALGGPVNVVAPEPVRNRDFARTLGRVLGRWAILPAPGFALRWLQGEAAEALVLRGARILPQRLREAGYLHADPTLEGALRHMLGRPERSDA